VRAKYQRNRQRRLQLRYAAIPRAHVTAIGKAFASRTHCSRGHLFTGELRPGTHGRICRICRAINRENWGKRWPIQAKRKWRKRDGKVTVKRAVSLYERLVKEWQSEESAKAKKSATVR